jgi:hypothetical protein
MLLYFISFSPNPRKFTWNSSKMRHFSRQKISTPEFLFSPSAFIPKKLWILPKKMYMCKKIHIMFFFIPHTFIFYPSYSYLRYYKWTYNLLCDIRHNEKGIRECEKLSWITHMNISIFFLFYAFHFFPLP